jgi:outer membrane biosynthesis protein TonB
MAARAAAGGLGLPLAASVALHAAAATALLLSGRDSAPVLPPMYRVNIVAAPAGPRAVGVVTPRPTPAPPAQAATPPRAVTPERAMPMPDAPRPTRRTPVPATPSTPTEKAPAQTTPAPQAGGGPTGGRGTDVANVRTEGIEFPFPGYLTNIVRQIALRFDPDNRTAALRAEVFFLIHRDGSVSDVRFITRSRNYAFDLEAQGAIDAAARNRAFGPLPSGFQDDVLPVIFSFDPSILR